MRRTVGAGLTTIVLAALAVALCGCGALGSEDSRGDSGGALEQSEITISVMPTIDLAPYHLATQNGYFAAEGLTVTAVQSPSGQASLSKLIGGDVDIAYSSYAPFFVAQSKGVVDLTFVADASYASPRSTMVVTVPGSPVTGVRDLAGRRIAVTSRNSISDALVKTSMKANGVDYSGVNWVELPFPDTAPALARGDIDAAFLTEPFLTDAVRKVGAVPVLDTAKGPTAELPTAGFASLAPFARDNPRTVAAFQRAMKRATDEAADRAKIEPLIVSFAKVDEVTAKTATLLYLRSTLDASQLQRVPDLLQEYGIIAKKVDVTTMLD
jgi:NitT/TauT family transport system substrate-binding protein